MGGGGSARIPYECWKPNARQKSSIDLALWVAERLLPRSNKLLEEVNDFLDISGNMYAFYGNFVGLEDDLIDAIRFLYEHTYNCDLSEESEAQLHKTIDRAWLEQTIKSIMIACCE